MAKILIVDDDVSFAQTVKQRLTIERHEIDIVHNPNDAFSYLAATVYDVILLDWQLPGMSGVDFLKKYRADAGLSYVIMLTVLSNTDNKVVGLSAGADDYLPKPFDMKELIARLNALLRRPVNYRGKVLSAGELSLDPRSRTVTRSGTEIRLKPLEFSVLEFFMQNPRQVIPPEPLLKHAWDSSEAKSTDSVYTCINRLRKKLNESGEDAIIKTIHGVGYRFDP